MEHFVWQKWNSVASFELTLNYMHKCLDGDELGTFLGILVEDIAHQTVDWFTGLPAKFNLLFNLLACSRIILLMEVEVNVHVQLDYFEDLDIEVLLMLN